MMKCSTPIFQLKILVHGKPVQEYHHDSRTFIEGRVGSNFELEMKNLTHRKLLAHPTVDGLSAMTGKEASMKDDEGYIIHPYQTFQVPGWRLNNEEVAQFFFAGGGKSYAEKTGKGKDKGVIACAVWEEEIKFYEPNWYRSSRSGLFTLDRGVNPHGLPTDDIGDGTCSLTHTTTNATFDNEQEVASCNMAFEEKTIGALSIEPECSLNNIGTGFGKKAQHNVYTVTFNKATTDPIVIATIYYDNLEGLRNRGIKISKKNQKTNLPNPFPADKDCTPPPGWRG
jgi:hypothetical protein